jgi:4'-phosphopantetheinyl transferase
MTPEIQPEPLRVDMWSLPLPASIPPDHLALLSDQEHQRAARRHRADDRVAVLAARVAVRLCLSGRLGLAPEAVRIEVSPGGRALFPDLPPGTEVSLSHGPGHLLVAICDGARLGIDLERVKPFDCEMAETVCSRHELAILTALPSRDRGQAFARLWTRKEAITKAVGTGLACDLTRIEVSLDQHPRLLRYDGGAVANWEMVGPCIGPGWEAALAVESRARPLDVRRCLAPRSGHLPE